ncbi:hypothetical protein ABGV42_00980 [Paenibacillus pabuli]|uniref:hypothetical protein n=1 Tax=Paenibacillus pabuli TaxID=1472 RepID=UPI0032423F68
MGGPDFFEKIESTVRMEELLNLCIKVAYENAANTEVYIGEYDYFVDTTTELYENLTIGISMNSADPVKTYVGYIDGLLFGVPKAGGVPTLYINQNSLYLNNGTYYPALTDIKSTVKMDYLREDCEKILKDAGAHERVYLEEFYIYFDVYNPIYVDAVEALSKHFRDPVDVIMKDISRSLFNEQIEGAPEIYCSGTGVYLQTGSVEFRAKSNINRYQ